MQGVSRVTAGRFHARGRCLIARFTGCCAPEHEMVRKFDIDMAVQTQ
jgi:hypothetical protein